jgi:protein-S-isoprenylcysteine O-methyltransferase Ste14
VLVWAIAWGGALLFVCSLAFFLYAYAVLFGYPAPPGSAAWPVLVNVLLFSAFALHHSVLARPHIKARLHRVLPPVLERSFYTWTASALLIAVCWWWLPVPGDVYRIDGPWRWLFRGLQVLGIVMTFFGSRAIDVLDLGGVRPLVEARLGRTEAHHVPLVTSGVYRIVRHPIYFGWVLLVFGAPDMTATRFTFAIVSTLYLAIAIPLEERSLARVFGPEYRRYQQHVRWRMIPGVY